MFSLMRAVKRRSRWIAMIWLRPWQRIASLALPSRQGLAVGAGWADGEPFGLAWVASVKWTCCGVSRAV